MVGARSAREHLRAVDGVLQHWRSFKNCAIFDCESGAVLVDLRHIEEGKAFQGIAKDRM